MPLLSSFSPGLFPPDKAFAQTQLRLQEALMPGQSQGLCLVENTVDMLQGVINQSHEEHAFRPERLLFLCPVKVESIDQSHKYTL